MAKKTLTTSQADVERLRALNPLIDPETDDEEAYDEEDEIVGLGGYLRNKHTPECESPVCAGCVPSRR